MNCFKSSLFFVLFVSQAFALSLEQVKTALKEGVIPRDSVEMNLRISVKAQGVYQQTDIYIANKRTGKSYTEIRGGFLNQRSIVNGSKMKIVDLKTNKAQLLDYNGEALPTNSYADFNPLDSGEWEEPKFLSGEIYLIKGPAGSVYYNSKTKRIEKVEAVKDRTNTQTTFTYDASNRLKKMAVSVMVNGTESVVTTEILRMRKSDKVPDSLFEL